MDENRTLKRLRQYNAGMMRSVTPRNKRRDNRAGLPQNIVRSMIKEHQKAAIQILHGPQQLPPEPPGRLHVSGLAVNDEAMRQLMARQLGIQMWSAEEQQRQQQQQQQAATARAAAAGVNVCVGLVCLVA